ncbi:MAG TPA: helix-turn-helix transcriptional regulator [Streptomyces sp.]
MSSAPVSALFTKEPSQVKMSTLIALCTALDCTPNDLFEVGATPVERLAAPPRPVSDLPKAASARGRSMPPLWPGWHRGRQTERLHRLRGTGRHHQQAVLLSLHGLTERGGGQGRLPPLRPAARPPGEHRPVHYLLTRMHRLRSPGQRQDSNDVPGLFAQDGTRRRQGVVPSVQSVRLSA